MAPVEIPRSLALTWRGWGTLLVCAGAVAAAAAAPSPAVIGLCAGVAVALGAAAITVVGACRRQVGTLRGTFTGP
ncbi:MAG TPA: hypothetical protein VHZ02_00610, partial [Acidimicrobiales bacterium]|nr:hypothetical protein [Acidimicrobiales bacterium]